MDGSATLGNRPPASGITKLRFRAGSFRTNWSTNKTTTWDGTKVLRLVTRWIYVSAGLFEAVVPSVKLIKQSVQDVMTDLCLLTV
jgi:hypothetical protein